MGKGFNGATAHVAVAQVRRLKVVDPQPGVEVGPEIVKAGVGLAPKGGSEKLFFCSADEAFHKAIGLRQFEGCAPS